MPGTKATEREKVPSIIGGATTRQQPRVGLGGAGEYDCSRAVIGRYGIEERWLGTLDVGNSEIEGHWCGHRIAGRIGYGDAELENQAGTRGQDSIGGDGKAVGGPGGRHAQDLAAKLGQGHRTGRWRSHLLGECQQEVAVGWHGQGAGDRLAAQKLGGLGVAIDRAGADAMIAGGIGGADGQAVLAFDQRHRGSREALAGDIGGLTVDRDVADLLPHRAGHFDGLGVEKRPLRRRLDGDLGGGAITAHLADGLGAVAHRVDRPGGEGVAPLFECQLDAPALALEVGAHAVDLDAVEVWIGGGAA
jgi:hypothetical protein